jgi:hypothetical protein
MEYHIRPVDMKHAVILPVGHEGEFKIKKDKMILRIPDEDKKSRDYQVISAKPVKAASGEEVSKYWLAPRPAASRPAESSADDVEKQLATVRLDERSRFARGRMKAAWVGARKNG